MNIQKAVDGAVKSLPMIYECRANMAQLANVLGVSRSQVGRWARGEAKPSMRHQMALSMMWQAYRNLKNTIEETKESVEEVSNGY